jgi:IS30 family transposase
MDIIGSREIAQRLNVSQETARSMIKRNRFESQIIEPGHGQRIRVRTTKRALLVYALKHGYPLFPDEEEYLKNLASKKSTPNGSDKGHSAVSVELNQPGV